MVETRFHVQWNSLFTGSKQKLIVMLYLSYLFLSNKDSVRAEKSQAEIYKSGQIFRSIRLDKRNFLWYC